MSTAPHSIKSPLSPASEIHCSRACLSGPSPSTDEVKGQFLKVYPEYKDKTKVFHNIINQKRLRKLAKEPGGFNDSFDGIRLLTVGRLTYQKAYPIAIEAMRLLKEDGYNVRWYVLGEGPERPVLEQCISDAGLASDFILCGAVDNPYPYYRQAGLYVHQQPYTIKTIIKTAWFFRQLL